MQIFAERLNAIRKKRMIPAHIIADYLQISLRNYRRYESGHVQPPMENLVLIADFPDVSLDYLMGRDEFFEKHYVE